MKMKHIVSSLRDLRDKWKMLKRKERIKKKCPFWGLNSRPSVSIHFKVILTYLNTLQSGGSA
jgi:hypothetical protein